LPPPYHPLGGAAGLELTERGLVRYPLEVSR